MKALILLFAALPAFASGPVQIVNVGGLEPSIALEWTEPLERLLPLSPGMALDGIDTRAVSVRGRKYAFETRTSGGEVDALESPDGFLVFLPGRPDLLERFAAESGNDADLPPLKRRKARLSQDSVQILGSTPVADEERAELATVYRLRVDGSPVRAVFFSRSKGGLGRAAAVLKDHGTRIVADAGRARLGNADPETLERLGLQVDGVGEAELRRLDRTRDYMKSHPNGTRYLSANLPDQGFEPYLVIERNGSRVGFFALTDPDLARRYKLDAEDPLSAARRTVLALRGKADVIVALSGLPPEQTGRLSRRLKGVDLWLESPAQGLENDEILASGGVLRTATVLDDSVPDSPGFPQFPAASYDLSKSTEPPLIPAADKIFPVGGGHPLRLSSLDFWTFAAAVLADLRKAEVGVFPVVELPAVTAGGVGEAEAAGWFDGDDELVTFILPGGALQQLTGENGLALGGVEHGHVHGVPIDWMQNYRMAAPASLLRGASPSSALNQAQEVESLGPLKPPMLAEMRRLAARWSPERYAGAMQGKPERERPYWTLNLRELAFNFTQTRVVKDQAAFARTPSGRVQGYDEVLIGSALRLDAERRARGHKWTNTAETEFAESTLQPPGQPRVIDYPANRISLMTTETERWKHFPVHWLGESLGPTIGLSYDGQVRKGVYAERRAQSVGFLPGFEIYDGSLVRSLALTGNFQRDYSRRTPHSNYGARARALVEKRLGQGSRATSIQSQFWFNYFFKTPREEASDLRFEGNARLKLQLPVGKYFSIAPFIDIDWFKLRGAPLNGYSLMAGVSLGFEPRIWKPGYERF